MNKELRHELERLARSEASSGRAALAKAQALRLLERLDRQGDVDYPVDDDGRFHPGPPEFWDLDRPTATKSASAGSAAGWRNRLGDLDTL
jgi:hypothetical protein